MISTVQLLLLLKRMGQAFWNLVLLKRISIAGLNRSVVLSAWNFHLKEKMKEILFLGEAGRKLLDQK